jgi:hypothetical protein
MEGGQLGTEAERRMIFIWEGAVATLPDYYGIHNMERLRMAMHRYDAAVQLWQINEFAIKWMWTIWVRAPFRIDICVTTRGPKFAEAVAKKCERRNWPVRYVFAESAQTLGRNLPTMPDVERVCYGLEEQRWAFGPQGFRLARDSGQLV